MKMRNVAAVAVPLVAAVSLSAGVSAAAPPPSDAAGAVHYTVSRSGDSAVIATDGHWLQDAGRMLLENASGAIETILPSTYRIDDTAYPLQAHIDGGTVTLTPVRHNGTHVTDPVHPTDLVPVSKLQTVAESFTPRDQQAMTALSQRLIITSSVSAVLGAIVGGGAGCLLGAAVGAAGAGVATLLVGLVPGAVVGCVVGAGLLGPAGALGGLILVGGPMLAFSAFQYFSTILSPCTTPGPYCADPAHPPATAPHA
ncbi:hypothetical protein ABIA39_004684 [Nocardia sp. GAS34]|uniref:hypothetical protein n=1 Tax=unclassified Nocardia TaxID=2637762 RepID=UPI003D21C3A5